MPAFGFIRHDPANSFRQAHKLAGKVRKGKKKAEIQPGSEGHSIPIVLSSKSLEKGDTVDGEKKSCAFVNR